MFFQKNIHHIGLKSVNETPWKVTSLDNVQSEGQWRNLGQGNVHGQGHVKKTGNGGQRHRVNNSAKKNVGQWKNTHLDSSQGQQLEKKAIVYDIDSVGVKDKPSSSEPLKEIYQYSDLELEGYPESIADQDHLTRSDSKDSVSPLNSPQRSVSSSCDTLDSLDSGLESSESLLNPEHSSSRDSLDIVDSVSCFPRISTLKYKIDPMSPHGHSYSPVAEVSSPLDGPLTTEGDSSPTLLSFRKRKSSVTEVSFVQSCVH